jgi:hypothetical protein
MNPTKKPTGTPTKAPITQVQVTNIPTKPTLTNAPTCEPSIDIIITNSPTKPNQCSTISCTTINECVLQGYGDCKNGCCASTEVDPQPPIQCASGVHCLAASDCTPYGFAHCVDTCCANTGTKSGKNATAKSAPLSLSALWDLTL